MRGQSNFRHSMEEFNPYQAPQTNEPLRDTLAEQERRAHIRWEAPVKAVGWVLIVVGSLLLAGSMTVFVLAFSKSYFRPSGSFVIGMVLGCVILKSGIHLRRFSRTAASVVSTGAAVLGLLFLTRALLHDFKAGILLLPSAFVLGLLCHQKSRRLFQPEYQTVMSLTCHQGRVLPTFVWFILISAGLLAANALMKL